MHKCVNNSAANVYHLEQFVSDFFPYSQKQLGFDKPVTIRFESDDDNAAVLLGKTAFYDPQNYEIALYIDDRHPKDIMRSLSHELVHHAQNCRGDFTSDSITDPGYAQQDPHLRKMEREAYTKGNLIFRDFEDLIKTGKIEVLIDFTKSGEPEMSLKEWKNNEINTKLMKKWGLLTESKDAPEEEEEEVEAKGGKDAPEKLSEDSGEEESKHYGEDEGADKHDEDRLERHLDAIEGHLKALRDDMGFDEGHIDENKEDAADLEEKMGRGKHYKGIGKKESVNMKGSKYGDLKDVKAESKDRKISVREARELTRRVLARIRKDKK